MPQTTTKLKYRYAVGRRKTATARVRYHENDQQPVGTIIVNNKPLEQYFSALYSIIAREALKLVNNDVSGYFTVKVEGGGAHAQAEALRHGIARVLVALNPAWRPLIKSKGFLTRDPRTKERKKPGLKRARRAPQWSKR